jgi:hypothetical protein
MARGTTLGQLVTMLREEIGDATSAALGQNNLPHLKRVLARTQEFLWNDHTWAHLRVYREEVLQAGQRYYSFPADLAFDRVENVHVRHDETWRPVEYGIELGHYNSSDPELDDRDDPVIRWQAYEDDQYEVWPLPATNGTADGSGRMRFEGIKKLDPLIADGDRAELDDNLIVLFAATEILARRDSKDAKAKENLATRLYNRLKGQQTGKKGMFVMGGGRDPRQGPQTQRPRPLYGRRIT